MPNNINSIARYLQDIGGGGLVRNINPTDVQRMSNVWLEMERMRNSGLKNADQIMRDRLNKTQSQLDTSLNKSINNINKIEQQPPITDMPAMTRALKNSAQNREITDLRDSSKSIVNDIPNQLRGDASARSIEQLKSARSRAEFKPSFRDPSEAFSDAIKKGILSEDPNAQNYAGRFMYMHTEPGKGDAFKHIDQRFYIFNKDNEDNPPKE